MTSLGMHARCLTYHFRHFSSQTAAHWRGRNIQYSGQNTRRIWLRLHRLAWSTNLPSPIVIVESAQLVAMICDRMLNELRAVVGTLGGERTLGRRVSSDRDLRETIREGFRPAVVEEVIRASGLTLKELASALDLSSWSLRYESDRLYRLARIVAIADDFLGSRERASSWLCGTEFAAPCRPERT